ncbi:hypothetical protein [Photobacterium leiognathi]|uniref:Uncharacterized protein n=1 Tax=Photobacterium leiognathi TaxID=553611 RepID=A0A2T3M9S7_PHOLE|nr:hypothetical protein [Photobacterium leiognathi]KJF99242.1 membrane protein [Photobacterium leiognathi]PSV89450.1 hypothetical protein CTM89_12185 [Photobacterium leiognathi]
MANFFTFHIGIMCLILLIFAIALLYRSMQKEKIWLSRAALLLMVLSGGILIAKQYQDYLFFSEHLDNRHEHSGFADIQ